MIVGGAVFASVEESQGITTSDGVWWAVTTVTTVGYGGAIYPHSTSGRIIGITNMVVGIGFAAPGKTFPKVIEPCGQPH